MENNFLYCFDKNYLIQAQTSINSLLNNVSRKINLFVICDNHETGNYIEQYFCKHKLVNLIKTFSFNSQEFNFPKLDGAHVTEATYYRIFISEILPKEIKTITYLDADIICLNDPLEYLNNLSRDLIDKEIGIAGATEGTRENSPILFDKLKLKNNEYFNAGVILINYKYWNEKGVQTKLLEIMKKRHEDLIFWDQDLLNIYFDGDYLNFSNKLNFNFTYLENEKYSYIKNNIFFLHYAGKEKPWNFANIIYDFSSFYQKAFRELSLDFYHIEFQITKKNIKNFLKIIFSLKFLKLDKPLKYIYLSIKSFIKNV